MRSYLRYVVLGLVAYVLFVCAQAPAAVLVGYFQHYLPIQIQQIDGSLLKGHAQGIVVRGAEIESLTWQWLPLALLKGRIEYRMSLMESQLELEGLASIGLDHQFHISDIKGFISLRQAISLALHAQLPLNGRVEVDLDEMRLGSDGMPRAAYGSAQLLNARTTLGRTLELGDFRTELTTHEQGIVGDVRDIGGPLMLSGTLTLTPDGRYRFTAQAALRDKHNRELQEVLSLLGRPKQDGKWTIDIKGVLHV